MHVMQVQVEQEFISQAPILLLYPMHIDAEGARVDQLGLSFRELALEFEGHVRTTPFTQKATHRVTPMSIPKAV